MFVYVFLYLCVHVCVCVYEVLAGCVHRQSRGCAKHERRAIRVQNTTRSPCRLDFPIRRSDWTNKSCPSLSAWQCASLATVAGSPASRIKIGNWRLVTGDWQPAGNRRLVWPGFRVSRWSCTALYCAVLSCTAYATHSATVPQRTIIVMPLLLIRCFTSRRV